MVLELVVRRFLDLEALDHGLTIFSFRVLTWAQFKRPDGWTDRLPAVVDTGAPFSVLPRSLWDALHVEGGFVSSLRGLVPLPSAILKARLGQVSCLVSDLKRSSPPLECWALLADGEVPLVLGCAGFLDRTKLMLDGPRQQAHLELTP